MSVYRRESEPPPPPLPPLPIVPLWRALLELVVG